MTPVECTFTSTEFVDETSFIKLLNKPQLVGDSRRHIYFQIIFVPASNCVLLGHTAALVRSHELIVSDPLEHHLASLQHNPPEDDGPPLGIEQGVEVADSEVVCCDIL